MLRFYLVMVVLLVLTACQARAPANQPLGPSSADTPPPPDDRIMLVFYRKFSFAAHVDDIVAENQVIECVSEAIQQNRPQQNLVSFDEFRSTAFPNLSPESAPRNPKYLSLLLQRTDFRDRIRPLGIRHIAFIGGVREDIFDGDSMICGGGYGGAGCIGVLTWDKKARLVSSVLDLKYSLREDNLNASASGMSWLAIVGIFPVGAPSDVVGVACRDLGTRLTRYLDGEVQR
jgi:hypothetical protein